MMWSPLQNALPTEEKKQGDLQGTKIRFGQLFNG
jgi:hypothetical protein